MRRLLALLLLPVLLLAACSSDDGSGGEDETPTGPTISDLAEVTVTGEIGAMPEVTFDGVFSTGTTVTRVVVEGEGPVVEAGQTVQLDYHGVNGRTGEEFDSSHGVDRVSLPLQEGEIIPGFLKGIVGNTVGSRVLIAVSPDDGYGPQGGVEAAGIQEDDTLLFVVDLHQLIPQRASGTAAEVLPGLPQVTLAEDGKPTITLPEADPPAELLVQPLIVGEGPQVEAGQTVTVHYTGLIWGSGEQFDSSWDRGRTAEFPIGVGAVISAWDIALVGQPVGSQVLVVTPPAQGYGEQGQPSANISGTDTLVFVVDVLAAS